MQDLTAPSPAYIPQGATRIRALSLLGKNLSPTRVAATLGVTESRISQFLSETLFSSEVQRLRFEASQIYSDLDDKYNSLEHRFLTKLEDSADFIQKPREILDAMTRLNNAKRRGAESPDTSTVTGEIVSLMLPKVIEQKFTVNIMNQVTEVTDDTGNSETLLTIQASDLGKLLPESPALADPGSIQSTDSKGEIEAPDIPETLDTAQDHHKSQLSQRTAEGDNHVHDSSPLGSAHSKSRVHDTSPQDTQDSAPSKSPAQMLAAALADAL